MSRSSIGKRALKLDRSLSTVIALPQRSYRARREQSEQSCSRRGDDEPADADAPRVVLAYSVVERDGYADDAAPTGIRTARAATCNHCAFVVPGSDVATTCCSHSTTDGLYCTLIDDEVTQRIVCDVRAYMCERGEEERALIGSS